MKIYREADLLGMLKDRAEQSTQRAVALDLGVAYQYVNDLISGRRKFSPKVAQRMGYMKLNDRYVAQRNGTKP